MQQPTQQHQQQQQQQQQPQAHSRSPSEMGGNRPKRYSSLRQRPAISDGPGQQNYPTQHNQHGQHSQHGPHGQHNQLGQHGFYSPQGKLLSLINGNNFHTKSFDSASLSMFINKIIINIYIRWKFTWCYRVTRYGYDNIKIYHFV